ncbi:LuxR C-terminal-related transcriptional regulator [Phycisphaeraceae bacterium D3-23]
MSDPLAGYGHLLAARLACEFPVQAAAVLLERGPADAPGLACALGARYAGRVYNKQLTQWCQLYLGGWLRRDRPTPENPVQVIKHSAKNLHPGSTIDMALFRQLESEHAVLARSEVGAVILHICLFLGPLAQTSPSRQAHLLRAALPAITGRLALVMAPPVVKARARTHTPLSAAEREIIPLLLQRNSERTIADRLGKSRNTVHTHVKSIYLKLGVHSRKELRRRQDFSENT